MTDSQRATLADAFAADAKPASEPPDLAATVVEPPTVVDPVPPVVAPTPSVGWRARWVGCRQRLVVWRERTAVAAALLVVGGVAGGLLRTDAGRRLLGGPAPSVVWQRTTVSSRPAAVVGELQFIGATMPAVGAGQTTDGDPLVYISTIRSGRKGTYHPVRCSRVDQMNRLTADNRIPLSVAKDQRRTACAECERLLAKRGMR